MRDFTEKSSNKFNSFRTLFMPVKNQQKARPNRAIDPENTGLCKNDISCGIGINCYA
jgi:hypothetical protein